MNCKNCNEEVEYADSSDEWFHSASYNTKCNPGRFDEHKYATPDHLTKFNQTSGDNEFYQGTKSESEIGSEPDYGSENWVDGNLGPKIESEIGSAQRTTTNGRGLVDHLTSLYPIITNLTLPVHQKLKAYDAINTLLKIATQAEARLGFTDTQAPTQDDVYNFPYYEG